MPTYSFRCASGDRFDAHFSLSEVPTSTECPQCREPAERVMTAPHLSSAGSAAFGLIDRSARSAHEPEVVSGRLPGTPRRVGGGVTTNPLHQKLPRD